MPLIRGHQEDGFYVRIELGVHPCKLEFKFKIGNCPQSPKNQCSLLLFGKMHQKIVEAFYSDLTAFIRQVGNVRPSHFQAVCRREHRVLAFIIRNGNDQVIDHPAGPFDDMKVALGHRIKSAGINANAFVHDPTITQLAPGVMSLYGKGQ